MRAPRTTVEAAVPGEVEVEYRWHDRTPQRRPEALEGHTLGRVVRVRGTMDAMLRGLRWPVGCMLYVQGEPLFEPGQRGTVRSRREP